MVLGLHLSRAATVTTSDIRTAVSVANFRETSKMVESPFLKVMTLKNAKFDGKLTEIYRH